MLFFILLTIFIQIFQLHALCDFPPSSQTITVHSPIFVTKDKDFDNTTFVGSSDLLNGDCDVNNGKMQYLMVLEDGVTIKNAIFDKPGMGIYCRGSCTLKNIYFKKLCYHGAGFGYHSTDIFYIYQVLEGGGRGSPDKYFTQSGRGTTIIKNFCAEGPYGKLWCSCGNCEDQMPRNVQMYNIKILGPGLTIASLNENYGDTASITGLALYGQNSPSTATEYVCQTYKGLKQMKSMRPITEFLPTEHGSGPCSYSISPINNHTPVIPYDPPAPVLPYDPPAPVLPYDPPSPILPYDPPAPVIPYDPPAPDVPDNNQPMPYYYNQPGGDLPYVITGGSERVGKIARALTGLILVSSTMLNGVGATAAAGNTNVVDHQQALAAKPSWEWKPPALGHLNASHVLQNMDSSEGSGKATGKGNANNGRRGNSRSVKKAKKPAVVHKISAKTVDAAPISRQNVFDAKARIVPPETDCIYISLLLLCAKSKLFAGMDEAFAGDGRSCGLLLFGGGGGRKRASAGHKAILEKASDVFEAMFRFDEENAKAVVAETAPPAEAIKPVVITDVKVDAFKAMLAFIYADDLSGLNGDNAICVLQAARRIVGTI
uniref:Probable pectate lyase F n=1 Tax=Globodera rostochiensis TaxID=31243 RepID=A0A914HKZ6_GLORO